MRVCRGFGTVVHNPDVVIASRRHLCDDCKALSVQFLRSEDNKLKRQETARARQEELRAMPIGGLVGAMKVFREMERSAT